MLNVFRSSHGILKLKQILAIKRINNKTAFLYCHMLCLSYPHVVTVHSVAAEIQWTVPEIHSIYILYRLLWFVFNTLIGYLLMNSFTAGNYFISTALFREVLLLVTHYNQSGHTFTTPTSTLTNLLLLPIYSLISTDGTEPGCGWAG